MTKEQKEQAGVEETAAWGSWVQKRWLLAYTFEGFSPSIVYPGGTLLFYNQDGPRPRR